MPSILYDLYVGNICPTESFGPRKGLLKKLDDEFIRASDAFSDKLEAPLAEEYEKLLDAHSDLLLYEQRELYIHGLSLGARLALELLAEDRERA